MRRRERWSLADPAPLATHAARNEFFGFVVFTKPPWLCLLRPAKMLLVRSNLH